MFCVEPSITAVPLTMRHGGDTADVVVVSFSGAAWPGWSDIGAAHATQLQSTIPSPIKLRMNPSCSTVRHHDADRRIDTVKTPSVRLAECVAGTSSRIRKGARRRGSAAYKTRRRRALFRFLAPVEASDYYVAFPISPSLINSIGWKNT